MPPKNSYNLDSGTMFFMNDDGKWEPDERAESVTIMVEKIKDVLSDAKVNYVSELVGKPVEVTIVKNTFDSFRILTEVL